MKELQTVDVFAVAQKMLDRCERWQSERMVGGWKYFPENDCVEFVRYGYWIRLDELKAPAGFLRWLLHLNDKNWFTKEVQRDFLVIVENVVELEKGHGLERHFAGFKEAA